MRHVLPRSCHLLTLWCFLVFRVKIANVTKSEAQERQKAVELERIREKAARKDSADDELAALGITRRSTFNDAAGSPRARSISPRKRRGPPPFRNSLDNAGSAVLRGSTEPVFVHPPFVRSKFAPRGTTKHMKEGNAIEVTQIINDAAGSPRARSISPRKRRGPPPFRKSLGSSAVLRGSTNPVFDPLPLKRRHSAPLGLTAHMRRVVAGHAIHGTLVPKMRKLVKWKRRKADKALAVQIDHHLYVLLSPLCTTPPTCSRMGYQYLF